MRTARGLSGLVALTAALLLALPAQAADPCETDPCAAGCADACWFNSHEVDPTKGVPVQWTSLPIKYKVNVSRITAGLDKTQVINAIKKAFQAWEGITCSKLAFQYAGESPSFTEEPGHVLVYWDYDAAYQSGGTWTHGDNAYWVEGIWTDYQTGSISKGTIGLNSTAGHPKYSYDWSLTPQANKFDVSLVTWLIPVAIGFYVGDNPANKTIPLFYNTDYSQLCQSHKDVAALTYFDSSGGCTKPNVTDCSNTSPPPPTDGSTPTGDGSTPTGDGSTPTGDGPPPVYTEGGVPLTDGSIGPGTEGYIPPGDDDDGCCRVSHGPAPRARLPFIALVGLGLLLLVRRRRR